MSFNVAPTVPVRTPAKTRSAQRRRRAAVWKDAFRWIHARPLVVAAIVAGVYLGVDIFIRTQDGLAQLLADHDPYDVLTHFLVVVLIAGFGLYAQHMLRQQERLREEAESASRAGDLAIRTKSEFLANMSHELRSPLNAIIGFAEIMKDEMFGPIGLPQYGEYCEDIHASGTHLLAIINDILDLSKIEAGKLDLCEGSVEIGDTIESCVRLMSVRAQEAGVTLETKVPPGLPRVRVDERKIKQILLNLLSNAVKFTSEGGRVETSARLARTGEFVLEVSDTGIGIAPEHIATVMSAFGQVDSSLTRKYHGTGLGLPLTKALVKLHGGTFALESTVDVGTRALVRLPAERVESTALRALPTPRPHPVRAPCGAAPCAPRSQPA